MAKLPIDLKHFKKSSSDKHTTTLEDKNGHQIRLVHSALSPDMREKLTALPMADGGKVKGDGFKKNAESFQKGFNSGGAGPKQMWSNIKKSVGFAEGGKVERAPEEDNKGPVTINIGQPAPQVSPAQDQLVQAPLAANTPNVQQVQDPLVSAPNASIPQGPAPASIPEPTQQLEAMASQPEPTDQSVPQAPTGSFMQGAQDKMLGMAAEADILGKQGNAEAKILERNAKLQQDAMRSFEENTKSNMAAVKDLADDYQAGHIDPNRLMSSKDTLGKIGTAIGLLLGGIGGGLLGQENPALKLLNQQIERDIEAQRAELGKKENLLKFNLQQFGNMKDATEMTRAMQAGIVASKLQAEAAKVKDPLAKARLLQAAGEYEANVIAPTIQKMSARQALNSAMSGGQEDQLNAAISQMEAIDPEAVKAIKENIIPGVGIAKNKDDVKTIKEVEERKKNIHTATLQLQKLIKDAGTFDIFGSHNDDIDRLADQIATDMAKLQDPNSVARPGEVEMVKKTLANPGIFQQDKTAMDKLEHFKADVERRANNALEARGIQRFKSKEPQVKYSGGKPYRKVDGGWQEIKK